MGEVVHLPPRGHYFAQEVGQLAGVSGGTIGQWANYEYIRASQSEKGEYPQVYSYQDVAEAIMVHELLTKRVPLQALRPVILRLRERFGDWPLQHADLETTSGKDVSLAGLLVRYGDLRVELGEHGWQIVEKATVNVERVARDLWCGGWAYRKLPDLKHIVVDPDQLSGRPAIRDRRIEISLVVELAGTIEGPEILAEDYGIDEEQTRDAVRWWDVASNFERVEVAA
jgi:uncharacterized protein (DUF433 family)